MTTEKSHFTIINGSVRFDGKCAETRPFCGAVCCRKTMVLLTADEKSSGKYDFIEPTENCTCDGCTKMRQAGKVALRRNSNGCIYLDGAGQCSIYEERPSVCKSFECTRTWWTLQMARPGE